MPSRPSPAVLAAIGAAVLVAAAAVMLARPSAPPSYPSTARGRGDAETAAKPAADDEAARPAFKSPREERGLSPEVRRVAARLFLPPQAYGASKTDRSAYSLLNYSVTVFDRDGTVVEEASYDAEGRSTGSTVYRLDPSGRAAGYEGRSADGDTIYGARYSRDEAGRLLRADYFDEKGEPTGSYSYAYDAAGRVTTRTMEASYEDGSNRRNVVSYSYDGAGRLLAEDYAEEDLGGVALRLEHAYEGGRKARTYHLQRGSWLEGIVFYSYDARGDLVKEASYQVPETVDDAPFRKATKETDLPIEYLSSEFRYEYEYFGD